MKPSDRQVPLQAVYTIFVEEPDDFYFHPRGVLFVDAEQNYKLFCSDVDHNFLLKVIRKFPYELLEQGVEIQGHQLELKNITGAMCQKFGDSPDAIPLVLQALYQDSPRHYSFLEKALQNVP